MQSLLRDFSPRARRSPCSQPTVSLGGKEAERVLRLLDMLDDLDDVQQVYANFDISDRDLEAAAA